MYSFRSASFTRNEEKMKKSILYPIVGAAALIAAFLYYYVTLPAINIHSSGFWFFLMGAVVAVMLIYMIRKTGKKFLWQNTAFFPLRRIIAMNFIPCALMCWGTKRMLIWMEPALTGRLVRKAKRFPGSSTPSDGLTCRLSPCSAKWGLKPQVAAGANFEGSPSAISAPPKHCCLRPRRTPPAPLRRWNL